MKVYAAPEEIALPELDYRDIPAYQSACDEYLASVQQWARDNSTKHDLAGETVSTPYADGTAVYVVAKINNSVCLIHINTWDGWRDPQFEELATVAYLRKRINFEKNRPSFAELKARSEARALAAAV